MIKLNKCLVLFFFILIFLDLKSQHIILNSLSNQKVKIQFTKKEIILSLYQMMKDVHEFLDLNQITYWAIAGTLLGGVRHEGIIPWDDDLDICIPITDKDKFLSIVNKLNNIGYEIKKIHEGGDLYRIFPKITPNIYMDILFAYEENDMVIYSYKETHTIWKRDGKPLFFYKNELFPLKLYNFGSIKVYGAHTPKGYLDAAYGVNWEKEFYLMAIHTQGIWHQNANERIKLTENLKVAAKPFGPLKNNF